VEAAIFKFQLAGAVGAGVFGDSGLEQEANTGPRKTGGETASKRRMFIFTINPQR
jgi:hypothetical protein